ncbi:MAG: alginate lyase family protein [Gemmatimonadota bacterium]|nr:alginate lyase family protein [Gemmatimonadota bacterium]
MTYVVERPAGLDQIDHEMPLTSFDPDRILEKLDLTAAGLEAVKRAADAGDRTGALTALRDYYRAKFPLGEAVEEGDHTEADKICRRIIQWGPYDEAQYGDDFDWEWDPPGDIEWVCVVYRFYWAAPLVNAYAESRDEKYARAFVDLASDWISKHPLEKHTRTHPVYKFWKGFAWLDLQTGIRATNICAAFRGLIQSEAFTPEFLGVLLASVYDHHTKTTLIPMGLIHNKAVFEQRGFINVAYTFSEFREARDWMELGLARVEENILAQTTTDGVQREWSFGYHQGVLRDAVEILSRLEVFDIQASAEFLERVRKMYDYIFWIASPDLTPPMFGDGSRPMVATDDRSTWPLYGELMDASKLFGDPKYAARANLDREALPDRKSRAFREAGFYVMRNDWGPDQIHMALHCSPPAISSHDQPDNGTFELYAYGRWLMNDTGFYTYGRDKEARAWHRQTSVHQTLTLDGRDIVDDARDLMWVSEGADTDVLVVENGSYPGLIHRRSVWFVDRRFFVLLDEAIGIAPGQLDLHFQFAPGDVTFDNPQSRAFTRFDNANVLVQAAAGSRASMVEETGWFAWEYGHRTPRKAFRFALDSRAPAAFGAVVFPYRGASTPTVSAELPAGIQAGDDRVEMTVSDSGKTWRLGRDLASGEGWAR